MNKDNILLTGKNTFFSEAKTLQQIGAELNEEFVQIVQLLEKIKGRVILTGIGKNQFIGKKIAATLNSIGYPSTFMHAGDAIHGDLGTIHQEDIIVCLSKSGDSPEIKVLVPLIKHLKVPLIGLSANPHSFLAKNANYHLHISIEKEACPFNLTPTNSTTAFLAMGDALAMCLMEARQITQDDFARFHPGGTLGKKLYLKVGDLYPMNAKPTVKPDTPIRDTILEISRKRLGATVVVGNDQILGMITDGDLRRLFEKNQELNGLTAADAMSVNPKTIDPDSFAFEALNLMRSNNITQLIVVANDGYLGIIHLHDILKEGIV